MESSFDQEEMDALVGAEHFFGCSIEKRIFNDDIAIIVIDYD
jgi:hypothetical protein